MLVSAIRRHESAIGIYMFPPSQLLPHPTTLGYHRASDLSSMHHTANSHWLSVLHTVMYMFQCLEKQFLKILIYLAVPDLSCDMQGLLVAGCELSVTASGI